MEPYSEPDDCTLDRCVLIVLWLLSLLLLLPLPLPLLLLPLSLVLALVPDRVDRLLLAFPLSLLLSLLLSGAAVAVSSNMSSSSMFLHGTLGFVSSFLNDDGDRTTGTSRSNLTQPGFFAVVFVAVVVAVITVVVVGVVVVVVGLVL